MAGPESGGNAPGSSDYQQRKIILPQSSRRLRHLHGLFARNMKHNGKLFDTYCKLYEGDEPEESKLLYQSEVVRGSLNPVWSEMPAVLHGGKPVEGVPGSRFLVVVYDSSAGGEERMRCYFELRTVRYIAPSAAELRYLSTPQVLFEFHDGIFASDSPGAPSPLPPRADGGEQRMVQIVADYEVCSIEIDSSSREPPDQTTPVSVSDLRYNLTRLVALSYSLRASQDKVAASKQRIAVLLDNHHRRRALAIKKQRTASQLEELRDSIRTARERLACKRDTLAVRKATLMKERQRLAETRSKLEERHEQRKMMLQKREMLKQHLMRVEGLISVRRQQLITSLRTIFPIEVHKVSDVLTVCGMHLGKDAATDDEAATALGYVAHCLQLLSRIWAVPLRYAVYPIASRSYIHEQFLDSSKPEIHPLFWTRGSDKQKYFQSVFLLNRNLRQLLQVRGLAMLDPKHMVFNLKQLLESSPDVAQCDGED